MKTRKLFIPFVMVLLFILTSCGYHNPYVYSGPDRDLYIATWHNRTHELLLHSKIHQALVRWYQKSGRIKVVQHKDEAQLILAGEIISIDLPSLSYGTGNDTTEVKVLITVRYILKDLKTDKVLMEVGNEVWTEDYKVGATSSENSDNEKEAIKIIIDDLSEKIYIKTLSILSKQNK